MPPSRSEATGHITPLRLEKGQAIPRRLGCVHIVLALSHRTIRLSELLGLDLEVGRLAGRNRPATVDLAGLSKGRRIGARGFGQVVALAGLEDLGETQDLLFVAGESERRVA